MCAFGQGRHSFIDELGRLFDYSTKWITGMAAHENALVLSPLHGYWLLDKGIHHALGMCARS